MRLSTPSPQWTTCSFFCEMTTSHYCQGQFTTSYYSPVTIKSLNAKIYGRNKWGFGIHVTKGNRHIYRSFNVQTCWDFWLALSLPAVAFEPKYCVQPYLRYCTRHMTTKLLTMRQYIWHNNTMPGKKDMNIKQCMHQNNTTINFKYKLNSWNIKRNKEGNYYKGSN